MTDTTGGEAGRTMRRRGKAIQIGDLLSTGRARAGGADEPGDPTDEEDSRAERGSSVDPWSQPPAAGHGSEEAQPQAAAAGQPEFGAAARPKEAAQVAQPARVEAMYVRIPADLKDRVHDASHQLRGMKATNQEIIAALIDQEVDPTTPTGLAAVRRRLERYRRTTLGS
jgi:hypothetical protein